MVIFSRDLKVRVLYQPWTFLRRVIDLYFNWMLFNFFLLFFTDRLSDNFYLRTFLFLGLLLNFGVSLGS
jgi:hypothetical protein